MLVLPLVDLLILMGTASLGVGFVVKVIDISTRYSPTLLGFSSLDFVVVAGICFGMALTLVARSWMKLNEPQLAAVRRQAAAAEARLRAAEMDLAVVDQGEPVAESNFSRAETASADRR